MILRLAVEQARSQRRYTIWTAAFLTLALAFVAFGLMLVATQRAIWDDLQRVSLADRAHGRGFAQIFGPVPDAGDTVYGPGALMSVEDIDRRLVEAIAGGSDVAATRSWSVATRPAATRPGWSEVPLNITAATGDYDWDLVLAEGALPGDGEILLNARVASELNLGVGDSIDLLYRLHQPSAEEPASESDWHPYTISGIARACDWENTLLADVWWCSDTSYVSWRASRSPDGPLVCNICRINDEGDTAPLIPVAGLEWNIDHPALTGIPVPELPPGTEVMEDPGLRTPAAAYVGYGLSGLVVAGMLLAALAVGRSQAQARIQWVATARTLGATRRAVVGATLMESLLVAAAATVGSLVFGYGIASVAFEWMRGFHGPTIGPSFVQMPWWVVAAVAFAGVVLSLLMSAVPAFWASRVSPVAAFKPVTDVTEVELSRRVPLWWVLPGFVGGLVAIWLGTREPGTVALVGYIGAILTGTTGFILLKEGLHWGIVTVGTRFARSRSPVLQVAGDGFVMSPRTTVTLALLFALPAALLAWLMVVNNFHNLDAHLAAGFPGSTWPLPDHESAVVWASGGVVWALIIVAEFEFVALAITFASRWAAAADTATRRALGLSTLQQRQAVFLRHAAPQIGGAFVGAIIGFAFGLATHYLTAINGASAHAGSAGDYLPAWGYSALSAGYGVLIVAAFASLGALVVAAAASRVRPPVEALKPPGKVRTR